jgi:hypothetical protein
MITGSTGIWAVRFRWGVAHFAGLPLCDILPATKWLPNTHISDVQIHGIISVSVSDGSEPYQLPRSF